MNTISYAKGICKVAEEMGVDPRVLTRNMEVKTAFEKRAFTLVELLTVAGILGLGAYGGKKGIDAIRNRNKPIVTPPSQGFRMPTFREKLTGLVSKGVDYAKQNPGTAAAVGVGLPLAAYGAYKAFGDKERE